MIVVAQKTYTIKAIVKEADGAIYKSLKCFSEIKGEFENFELVREIADWIDRNLKELVPYKKILSSSFNVNKESDGSMKLTVTFRVGETQGKYCKGE